MATNSNPTFLDSDLACGDASRVVALRVLDGVPGWAVADTRWGRMAYAPMWLVNLTGEIAREV